MRTKVTEKSLGQVAYEAHHKSTVFVQNWPLEIPEEQQRWERAAQAAVDAAMSRWGCCRKAEDILAQGAAEERNRLAAMFLNNKVWKILRHMGAVELGAWLHAGGKP